MFKNLSDRSRVKFPWICHLSTGGCDGCDQEIWLSSTKEQAR